MESSRLILSRMRAAYRSRAARCGRRGCVLLVAARRRRRRRTLTRRCRSTRRSAPARCRTGCTYFIRRNTRPDNRAMLRLAVKAGSMDEADDQRGLAHVLEHMAFNGTTHFKPGELVKYLESIGARFGPHVNAYTSFDETVYMLDVPTDRAGRARRAASRRSATSPAASRSTRAEIDRERGVVIEEWRGRLGAGTRMQAAADQRALRRVALRRPAADRHAGDPQERSRRSACAISTATTTAPTAWRSSSSATSIRRTSKR